MNKDYRELAVGKSGQVALIDADLYLKLARYRWIISPYGPYRYRTFAGKQRREYLSHVVTAAPRGRMVRHLNQNKLDCRRANLLVLLGGSVSRQRCSRRNPWRVRIDLEGEVYFVGAWPTAEMARYILRIVSEQAANLRGRGLPRERVQRVLDLAAGRIMLRKAV